MQPKPQSLRDLREYPILYVDDEPENLRIFELTFRRDFHILTAESGDRGLEIIHNEPVALVLSDHRMPGMTGTQFLSRVAEIDPKTIRIMVTAYGDAETLRDAINDGSIYHFIPKPWEPEDVRATLLRAIEAYALDRERGQLLLELMVLHRVSYELNGQLEMSRLLGVLTSALHEELGFDGASVLLADARTGLLRMVSQTSGRGAESAPAEALEIGARNAPDLYKRLASGRSHTLRMEEALDYPDALRSWVHEVAAEEILVTPLHGKDGLLGAIAVDNRRGGSPFSADDGTLIEGLCNQAAIAIENARLVGELRASREQVRRAERQGTLGTLAASLAHEIDEPLAVIQDFLSRAQDERGAEGSGDFWSAHFQRTCHEAERIRDLVTMLRRMGRSTAAPTAFETTDIENVARDVVALLRRDARLAGVDVSVEGDPEAPKIVAVREQIEQVILNLVLNALAATPSGGAVHVLTRAAANGEGVEIEVRDTGPGIPPEHLEQIFDPFFSTRSRDDHAGLGLMICQRVVAQHGGSIEVRNGASSGACFLVRLPRERRALDS